METNQKHLSYADYYDKVYGCFLGKCIGGTAGGPAEGRKELLDFPLNEELLHKCLPNDDLDLQILWLELLESEGFDITARDMAREFYEKVPYGPGEYAYFKKNFARGIYPPLSGSYNNRYYKNGMGCPIRSEVWACIFPGADETRGRYVEMDGSLDHERDSIDGEKFLAALESELFFSDDLRLAIETAQNAVPADSKLDRVLRDTIRAYDEGCDWKFTRGMILRNYGHADCTNMYQNLGFILISLLYGKGDFRETIRLGLACGYDTDCICATAASVLGIIRGAKNLLHEDGMSDTGLAIAIGTKRKTGSIADLARDVCAVGICAGEHFPDTAAITEYQQYTAIPDKMRTPPITVEAVSAGNPTIGPDAPTEFALALCNNTDHEIGTAISIAAPDGIGCMPERMKLCLKSGERYLLSCRAEVLPDTKILCETNLFTVRMSGTFGEIEDQFGLVGCSVWYRYGPFLQNIRDISDVPPHNPYSGYLSVLPGESLYDITREYHLGGIADINNEFVSEAEPFIGIKSDGRAECVPERISIHEDLFDTAAIQKYEGAHVDYLVRRLICPEERKVEIAVGHTAPFKLWVNGKLIGMSNKTKWWTLENMHFSVTLSKGANTVVLKCAQQSDHAKYSIVWRGYQWSQFSDFASELVER